MLRQAAAAPARRGVSTQWSSGRTVSGRFGPGSKVSSRSFVRIRRGVTDRSCLASRPGSTYPSKRNGLTRQKKHSLSPGGFNVQMERCYSMKADLQKSIVVDSVLQSQTFFSFRQALATGILPSGKQSSRRTLTNNELAFLVVPPSDWDDPRPDLRAAAKRFVEAQLCLGSDDDFTNQTSLPAVSRVSKSKIWFGIPSISEAAWTARRLDDVSRNTEALVHLNDVSTILEWHNHPQIQDQLRAVYNNVYSKLEEAEAETVALCNEWGIGPYELPGRWFEYVQDLYQTVCKRAHGWILSHAQRLVQRDLTLLFAHTKLEASAELDDMQKQLMDRIAHHHGAIQRADISIILPLDGYHGYVPVKPASDPPYNLTGLGNQRSSANLEERRMQDAQAVGGLLGFFSDEKSMEVALGGKHVFSLVSGVKTRETCFELWRKRMWSDLMGSEWTGDDMGPTPWIRDMGLVLDPPADTGGIYSEWPAPEKGQHWGYIGYRLSHGQSEEEWAAYKAQLEKEALEDWAANTKGADRIRPFFKIHWLDGRELGISDGDLNAARDHFLEYRAEQADREDRGVFFNPPTIAGEIMCMTSFLAFDDASWKSHLRAQQQQQQREPSDAATINNDINNANNPSPSPSSSSSFPYSTQPQSRHQQQKPTTPPGLDEDAAFLTLVEPDFLPDAGPTGGDYLLGESRSLDGAAWPGYRGHMRVLNRLLVAELHPLLVHPVGLMPRDLWGAAMLHPRKVYVGALMEKELGELREVLGVDAE